jgi:hypothetical protein
MFDDPVSQWLIANGIEVTRETWLRANYLPDPVPTGDDWGAELEAEIPEALQKRT